MTTLIIEVPDSETSEIAGIIKAKGGNVVHIDADDEDLTKAELALLKRGLNEALLIKEGKLKPIPFSELWNDWSEYLTLPKKPSSARRIGG